jgi:hypothetical protein
MLASTKEAANLGIPGKIGLARTRPIRQDAAALPPGWF